MSKLTLKESQQVGMQQRTDAEPNLMPQRFTDTLSPNPPFFHLKTVVVERHLCSEVVSGYESTISPNYWLF